MSKKRTDRPTAGRDADDDDENDEHQPNKSARLDEQSAVSSSVGSPLAAAASAVPTIVPALSPAQRLYSDALISVFGLLDLRELISAHSSCRSWRDAAYKEPSRKNTLLCDPSELDSFSASPLRHHVGEYSSDYRACTLEQVAFLRAFPALTQVTIRVEPSCLAPLTALQGQAGYAEIVAATVAQWPSNLMYLDLTLSEDEGESRVAEAQALIGCIGQLDLMELVLQLPEGSLRLQPLLQLTELQALKLVYYSLGSDDCAVIKQLSSLTDLNLKRATLSLEALQALCSPPHQLASLQRIDLGEVTAAHMEALAHLPALSTFDLGAMDLTAAAYLPRFPQLRTLHLHVRAEAASTFMPHLAQCAQLTALEIQWSRLTLADLTELSRSLTALTSLEFRCVRIDGLKQPDSLSCLHSLPHLRELNFIEGFDVRLVHLVDDAFTSLPSLRSLRVDVPDPEVPAARSLFRIPCKIMPQLTYTRIQSNGEEIESEDEDDD